MDLPRPLKKEILNVVRRKGLNFTSNEIQDLYVTVDDSFLHHGQSGADIQRIAVSGFKNDLEINFRFVVKPWESTKWLTLLMGIEKPIENILFENGFFEDVNAIEGLYVPIVSSVRLEKKAWVIMEDVTDELAAWKASAFGSAELILQCELLDRVAFFHVQLEQNKQEKRMRFLRKQLVPQERRLRWFEQLCQEWFDDKTSGVSVSPALQTAKEKFSQFGHGTFLNFVERLPRKSRIIWQYHMQNRDSLVSEASKLPTTFLHGDLLWKNIGVRQETSRKSFVLIDWEIATLGHHAFDVYYFISEPFRSVDVWDQLFEYYYARYLYYGGSNLNRDQWNRGVELAIAHYGLSWLPLFAEWARNDNDEMEIDVIDKIIERTDRALRSLPI